MEFFVIKIFFEQAELPQVIGDVFADVSHGPVRAHDDLGFFVGNRRLKIESRAARIPCRRSRHHPAAFVLALGFQVKHLPFDHELARRVPEVQGKNLGFARQEIVLDAEALHGFEMAAQDRGGDQFCNRSDVVTAGFESVERV